MMKSTLANYFDYAAATPVLPEVVAAMQPYYADKFYNPSALYLASQTNREALEVARHTIAVGLGAKSSEIIFTAGGTEANNLAIRGILEANPGCNVVTCAIEHKSVLAPAKLYDHKIIGVDAQGFIKLAELKKAITDKTVLVSIGYANNEIGAIQPMREIAAMVREIRETRQKTVVKTPLYFHTDACQVVNYLDLHATRLGIDLMTLNAGKIYGPKQCGALYVKSGIKLTPLILGGGQEKGMRSGTENLANIVGFAKAFEVVRADCRKEAKRLADLKDEFFKFTTPKMPKVIINGPLKNRLPSIIHITIPGVDNETLLMQLDEKGFMVSTGSACNASGEELNHVLKAIGLTDSQAHSSLRITLGRHTTKESLISLAKTLCKIDSV